MLKNIIVGARASILYYIIVCANKLLCIAAAAAEWSCGRKYVELRRRVFPHTRKINKIRFTKKKSEITVLNSVDLRLLVVDLLPEVLFPGKNFVSFFFSFFFIKDDLSRKI